MNKIEIGKVRAKGGLNQAYQDVSIQLKLGNEPKIGLEMTLKDSLTNKIIQRPMQIMFNENELNKLANLRFLLSKAEQVFSNYQKSIRKRLIP